MHCTLEVCVDSTASALAAKRGGADRLELCADLIIGGTTPSPALLRQVKAETGLPVRALLRPRFGDFCYDRYELAQMAECAAELVAAGADGIVTGVLTPAGALDTDALRPIYAAARQAAEKAHRTVDCTLHRAFDVCCDPFAALEAAKQLGLATILTSGQAASAPQGAALLRQLVEVAGQEVEILVGAGVSADNIPAAEKLAAALGAEIGCTRPVAEEEHWYSKDRYIGVSGVMIKPNFYLAIGISGQIQHMVGVNQTNVICAINKDENAPIIKQADYTLIGDVNAVLPAIIEKLG